MTSCKLVEETKVASAKWANAFNTGDAAGCAAQYLSSAVMTAKPFGTFTGTEEIRGFWQKLVDDGFSSVEYVQPTKFEVQADNKSVILSSNWKMNKASGVITKELWVLQADGSMKLAEDNFEVTG
eukprot:GHVP01050841.1.p1 GENE.GHVP01050841.1~~GHVP01050841.1.p1  ORF type:complete len:125 (+),score=31.41 GHVP01050841.1:211-585(+)